MARLKIFHRDSLGWLIPVLLFFICYGGYLWFNEVGFLRNLGIIFVLGGLIGLAFSRRVRRLAIYYMRPRTPERRESFMHETMMEAAKRAARKAEIPQLITHFYFDYIVHLPQWWKVEKKTDEMIIPPIITAARKMPGNRIAVTLSGKEYIFTFVQYVYSTAEGERDIQATLQIADMHQKLILLHLVPHQDDVPGLFYPISIEHVVMSDWINDFRHLHELITEERKKRQYEDRMN